MGNLDILTTLDLQKTGLSGNLPDSLGNFVNTLLYLNLNQTNLTGPLPDKFADLHINPSHCVFYDVSCYFDYCNLGNDKFCFNEGVTKPANCFGTISVCPPRPPPKPPIIDTPGLVLGIDVGLIAGITLSVLSFILIVIVIAFLCYRHNKSAKKSNDAKKGSSFDFPPKLSLQTR